MEHISILKSVSLGALQGATEFLPVSSSGHLVIAQHLLDVKMEGGQLLAFDVCLHFGTLLAVLAVFWREISGILISVIAPQKAVVGSSFSPSDSRKLFWFLIIGTIPAGFFGILFKDFFESLFSTPFWAAVMLIVTGFILWFTRYIKGEGRQVSEMGFVSALLIGVAQAVAIIPGISRSGSTISGGIYFGINRDLAAKFSFLLSVPAILGAAILQLGDLKGLSNGDLLSVGIGTFVSFIVGIAAIKWLLSIIRRHSFHWFAIYCWIVGSISLLILL